MPSSYGPNSKWDHFNGQFIFFNMQSFFPHPGCRDWQRGHLYSSFPFNGTRLQGWVCNFKNPSFNQIDRKEGRVTQPSLPIYITEKPIVKETDDHNETVHFGPFMGRQCLKWLTFSLFLSFSICESIPPFDAFDVV